MSVILHRNNPKRFPAAGVQAASLRIMDFVFSTKTSTVYSLLDVLLRLVVFLCEVLCRDLAGDLDEGQLFAVPGGVAGRLTHAEVVVSFHQEIWREDEQRPVV